MLESSLLAPGTVVDNRFRITAQLGDGWSGATYEAEPLQGRGRLAIKLLRPELARDAQTLDRLRQGARALKELQHPNVAPVLDDGMLPSGSFYYTRRLLTGRDLAAVLADRGRLEWSRAGWIVLQTSLALAAIHERGLTHQHLKPTNCFLLEATPDESPDRVSMLDFGLAKLPESSFESIAATGHAGAIGSAAYMAPEQNRGIGDARSDLYGLGIMLYEMLTGELPFKAKSAFQLFLLHSTEPIVPPRTLVREIPAAVEAIIVKLLAKEPSDRFASAHDLIEALRALPNGVIEPPSLRASATAGPLWLDASPAASPVVRPTSGTVVGVEPPPMGESGGTVTLSGAELERARLATAATLSSPMPPPPVHVVPFAMPRAPMPIAPMPIAPVRVEPMSVPRMPSISVPHDVGIPRDMDSATFRSEAEPDRSRLILIVFIVGALFATIGGVGLGLWLTSV